MTIADLLRPPRVEDVAPELAPAAVEARARGRAPLFVQIPTAVGLTLASALLCFGFAELLNDERVLLLGGVVLAGLSIGASWLPLPWFARPVVLIGAVLARFMIALPFESDLHVVMPVVELAMLVLHRDPLNRALAAAAMPGWVMTEIPIGQPATALALLGGGTLVLTRRHWLSTPAVVREGLAATATGWLGFALVAPSIPGDPWSGVFTVLVGLVAAGCALAVARQLEVGPLDLAAAALAPLAIGALTVPVPGVLVGLVVALVGFVGRSPRLWTAGIGALVAYGVWFYYDLDWGLAAKGGAMIAVGVVLVAAARLAHRHRELPSQARDQHPGSAGSAGAGSAGSAGSARWGVDRGLVILGGALVLVAVSGSVGYQELQLARSETVYLPLAPRDPRSLVQGDFMRLGYDIERPLVSLTAPGSAVVRLDERGVATFARPEDGSALAPDERRIRFYRDRARTTVTSRAYLFQEGTAELYEDARYGVVALTPEGRAALVGLADAELRRLGPPPRRW